MPQSNIQPAVIEGYDSEGRAVVSGYYKMVATKGGKLVKSNASSAIKTLLRFFDNPNKVRYFAL